MYVKITNLNIGGTMDYKGVNLEKIIPNSQRYSLDSNMCIIETTEEITVVSIDLTIIDKLTYDTQKEEIENLWQPIPPVVIVQPTNKEISDNQYTIMDVLATMYEEMVMKGTV